MRVTKAAARFKMPTRMISVRAAPPDSKEARVLWVGEFGVDQQRQRSHIAFKDIEVDGSAVADKDQHRRRLTDDARHRKQHARNDAGQCGRYDYPQDCDPLRNSQGVTGFSQLVGNKFEHFFGVPHDYGKHE